jgi:hypothetical protein
MYDSKGNLIPSGSMVTEGDLIEFKIEYTITGQQLAVMNGNTITVKSDTLLYTLPKIFEMVQSDSGNILNSSGQIVGEYMIDSETGTIHLKTDSQPLHESTLEVIEAGQHRLLEADNDIYGSGRAADDEILSVKTFYEQQFLAQGLPITYLRFKLNPETHA